MELVIVTVENYKTNTNGIFVILTWETSKVYPNFLVQYWVTVLLWSLPWLKIACTFFILYVNNKYIETLSNNIVI